MNWWKRLIGPFTTPDTAQDGLSQVQLIIGYHFRNESLLALALTHRSFSNARDVNRVSNERLEYLGDSVLGLVIADRLYHDHPDLREGELTKLKAMLVN